MFIGVVSSDLVYTDQILFENKQGLDDLLLIFKCLRDKFQASSIKIETCSKFEEKYDFYIFNEYPKAGTRSSSIWETVKERNIPSALLSLENSIVRPDTYKARDLSHFHVIFSWDDRFFSKYNSFTKINFAVDTCVNQALIEKSKVKKIVCIAANKYFYGEGENYSLRKKDIVRLDRQNVIEFELYGNNWDRPIMRLGYMSRYINYFLKRLIRVNPPAAWRGTCPRKSVLLSESRFNLCYENASNSEGYITEKILQSLLTGSIPIYLGADNITDHVPLDLVILRNQFETIYDVLDFINNLDENFYRSYDAKLLDFLQSGGLDTFCVNVNAEKIFSVISGRLNTS